MDSKTALRLLAQCVFLILVLILASGYDLAVKNYLTVQRMTDGRAKATLDRLIREAEIKERIELYSRHSSCVLSEAAIGRDKNGIVFIEMGTRALRYFSDSALEGLLAHELGHLVAGHLETNAGRMHLPSEKLEQKQKEADIVAIQLAGREAVNAYRKAVGVKEDGI